MKSIVSALFLSSALLAAAPGAFAADAAPEAVKPPSVTVTEVAMKRLSEQLQVNGTVTPVDEVAVGADVAGLLVTELAADVGDAVKQGQVLARLDTANLETQLAQVLAQEAQAAAAVAQAQAQIVDAEIGVKLARDQWERADRLTKSGVASTATLDNARSAFDSASAKAATVTQALAVAKAQAALAAAQRKQTELQIAKAEVKAPADGVVLARNAQLGAVVSGAAGPLFRIAKDVAYEASANVSEADMQRLAEGMAASVKLSGVDGAVAGKVRRVDPEINAQTRLGKVRIWLEPDPRVRPGAFAAVQIVTAERETPAVAASAVIYSGRDAYLQFVKDGVAETRKVRTGIRQHGLVEIAEGASVGDDVIERAGTFIANGDHVTPVKGTDQTGALQ